MAGFRYRLVCCTVFFWYVVRYCLYGTRLVCGTVFFVWCSSGMWYGILGTVLYGRVPVSSGMWYGIFVWSSSGMWYGIFRMVVIWYVVRYFLVCGTVFSGMWYGIFCMVRYGLVYEGCGDLVYRGCGHTRQTNLPSPKIRDAVVWYIRDADRQTDRKICIYQNRDSVLQTENTACFFTVCFFTVRYGSARFYRTTLYDFAFNQNRTAP